MFSTVHEGKQSIWFAVRRLLGNVTSALSLVQTALSGRERKTSPVMKTGPIRIKNVHLWAEASVM